MKARAPGIAAAVTALAFFVACSSSNQDSPRQADVQASQPRPAELRKVWPPDLTGMAPGVQQQLRDQFDALGRIEANTSLPPDRRADAYGELGKLLLAAESFADAETCFLNASQLNPSDSRWPYYLAHAYRAQGESQKAASYFERALKARPDDVAALVWLGNVYLDQGRPLEADPQFSRALARDSRVAAAHIGLGRVALASHDYKRAIEHLEAALALDRSANSVHYSLAAAYRGAGRTERADAHLRQRGPVQIGPPDPLMQQVSDLLRSPVTYESRGDRALARGEFPKAVTEFRSGLELAPENLALRQKLATASSLTGDVQGAVQQWQELLRRDPKFASAHYSLGVLLLADGQTDLAIERFTRAVQYDPTYLQARLQLANTLRSRGRFEAAREQYAAVIKLDPRIGEARFGHAVSLAGLGRFDAARDRLTEGMRLHPDRVEFVSALAMALAEVGRYDEAARTQRDAVALAERTGQADLAKALAANLQLFERGQPSRTPWRESPIWIPNP